MVFLDRRTFFASVNSVLVSGCNSVGSSSTAAHWVSVFLGERDETHTVTVTITSETGDVVFEKEYELADSNEADEHAPFLASTQPANVIVTVDGERFEYGWPGFEHPALPCEGPNRTGIELWIQNGPDSDPDVWFEANCQHVIMSS